MKKIMLVHASIAILLYLAFIQLKSLQQQKERRGNDGKPKKKTSFEDNWMDEDFDDFHDIPSTNNKNREQNTNNATGANEKQMKSNTIDKRQKKKINSLPFSEKEEKFDINISNNTKLLDFARFARDYSAPALL